MELVRICVGNTSYTVSDNYLNDEKSGMEKSSEKVLKREHMIAKIKESDDSSEGLILTLLAVCHTVIPEVESQNPLSRCLLIK